MQIYQFYKTSSSSLSCFAEIIILRSVSVLRYIFCPFDLTQPLSSVQQYSSTKRVQFRQDLGHQNGGNVSAFIHSYDFSNEST